MRTVPSAGLVKAAMHELLNVARLKKRNLITKNLLLSNLLRHLLLTLQSTIGRFCSLDRSGGCTHVAGLLGRVRCG